MKPVVDVMRALAFAAEKHVHHRRKGESQEPYINHLAEVGYLLAEATAGADPALVIAGLLHDTVEDVGVSAEELAAEFGAEVAAMVAQVTDDKSLEKETRKQIQIEDAPVQTDRVKMLRLADKTSNLRSLVASPPVQWGIERKREYIAWAARVAEGCRGVNAPLEAAFDEAHAAARAAMG